MREWFGGKGVVAGEGQGDIAPLSKYYRICQNMFGFTYLVRKVSESTKD